VTLKTAWERVNGKTEYIFFWDFKPSPEFMDLQFDTTFAFGFSADPFSSKTESYAFNRKSGFSKKLEKNITVHGFAYNTVEKSLLEVADTGITNEFFKGAG
jgi:hypothetical protein